MTENKTKVEHLLLAALVILAGAANIARAQETEEMWREPVSLLVILLALSFPVAWICEKVYEFRDRMLVQAAARAKIEELLDGGPVHFLNTVVGEPLAEWSHGVTLFHGLVWVEFPERKVYWLEDRVVRGVYAWSSGEEEWLDVSGKYPDEVVRGGKTFRQAIGDFKLVDISSQVADRRRDLWER